jgi:acetyl-CoA synthase
MSKLVAFAAIQGGYNIVSQVEGEYKRALETFDADTKVGFPNTAYFLPVISQHGLFSAGDLLTARHQG